MWHKCTQMTENYGNWNEPGSHVRGNIHERQLSWLHQANACAAHTRNLRWLIAVCAVAAAAVVVVSFSFLRSFAFGHLVVSDDQSQCIQPPCLRLSSLFCSSAVELILFLLLCVVFQLLLCCCTLLLLLFALSIVFSICDSCKRCPPPPYSSLLWHSFHLPPPFSFRCVANNRRPKREQTKLEWSTHTHTHNSRWCAHFLLAVAAHCAPCNEAMHFRIYFCLLWNCILHPKSG